MLTTILTILVAVSLAMTLYKYIHKYNVYLYVLAAITAIVFYITMDHFILGFLPLGLFLVVMFTGALPKSTLRKRLNGVRSEYAIIGFILLVPHATGVMLLYLTNFGVSAFTLQTFFGSIAFYIMMPLFVTSFQKIRRKMTFKTWKRLHRFAYIIYFAIYMHLLLIQNERFYIYLVVGIIYFALKLVQYVTYLKKRMA